MGAKRRIFISYSHKDTAWLDRLRPFLQQLVREDEVQVWSDTDIRPSADWDAEIRKALNEADAAILLISQDFLASRYISGNELPILLRAASERGLRIFPVFVSSSYIKENSPLLRFQGVNPPNLPLDKLDRAKQNEVFARLAKSVDEVLLLAQAEVEEEWLEKFRSRFVPVPGGRFLMGDAELHRQLKALQPIEMDVASFHLGQFVVTQAEWVALMKTQPWVNGDKVRLGDDNPAVFLTSGDVLNFILKINTADRQFNYRLPLEREWEFAARGGLEGTRGTPTKFCFGDDENKLVEYGWHDRNASALGEYYAHPVGQLKPNQLNIFDMHGNIWEWTSDGDRSTRIVRGGGFNAEAKAASSAFRLAVKPEMRGEALGFRLVREPKPAT